MTVWAWAAIAMGVLCVVLVYREAVNTWWVVHEEREEWFYYLAALTCGPGWMKHLLRWHSGIDTEGRVYIWKQWRGLRYHMQYTGARRIAFTTTRPEE